MWGSFKGGRSRRGGGKWRVRVSPECIDSTVPQFLSLFLSLFSSPSASSPSALQSFSPPSSSSSLFPGSRSTSTRPSSIRPSLPLQSSPRLPSSRGFIGSLIAASVSLDRLTTYVDAIFKILRNTCPCVVRRDDDQGDELLLGLMVLEIGFVRDVRGGGLILFFSFSLSLVGRYRKIILGG